LDKFIKGVGMAEKEYERSKELKARKKYLMAMAEKCAKLLKEKYKVKRVFLIGSLVYGKVHSRSDIDLVVEGLMPEQYIKALVDLSDLLQWKVEINLIPFEDAFESLKKKTLKKGKIVYG
jgi:predicted nucleotidyltransferase